MSKALESAVSVQIVADQRRPALLFEMGLSGVTLYWTNSPVNINFGGITYSSKAIRSGDFVQSAEGQINRVTIDFDNTNKEMASYVNCFNFDGQPLIIKRVYLGDISNANYYNEVFRGFMEQPESISRFWVSIPATVGKPLYNQALLQIYGKKCRHSFGNAYCNVNNFADLGSTSSLYSELDITSGGTNFLTLDQTSGTTVGAVDDFFNFGLVKVGKSGVTYNRICSDYISSTSRVNWVVGVPVTIDNTYRAQVYKGCDKT
ncbi:MAG: hypothetical protein ABIG69_09985, partial [Bacteroidota bacterium]